MTAVSRVNLPPWASRLAPVGLQGRQEAAAIVEPEVVGIVLRFGEGDLNAGQDLSQGGKVQGLGVGNDSVKIKNDGA